MVNGDQNRKREVQVMKRSAVMLVFLLLMSMSVMALANEAVTDLDDAEVQQVDVEGVNAMSKDVLQTDNMYESEIPEVVVFDNHIRPILNASVQNVLMNENVDGVYFENQSLYTGTEGSWTVTIGQRNAILLCFHFASNDNANVNSDGDERENRPDRNDPLLWRS
jgi:hypothetical protein